MQRLTKEAVTPPSAVPRQLEPISSVQAQRASTASPVFGSRASQVSSNGSPIVSLDSEPATDLTWSGKPIVRSSALIPVPILPQHRGSAEKKYLVIEQAVSQHRVSTLVSSTTQRDTRKISFVPGTSQVKSDEISREDELHEAHDTSTSESDESASLPAGPSDFEKRQLQKLFRDTLGSVVHEEGGKQFRGRVDKRGLTPFVTFSSTETPPSETRNPLLSSRQPTTCGFCNSTKLVWILQCSFCGSSRMSDAPRLKYLIEMILTMEPLIKPEQLGKKILDYARFDRVAMKVEAKLKEAGLVRARTAIMMMSRTIHLLREQMVRIVFRAWKNCNASDILHAATIARMIRINGIQTKKKSRQIAFQLWRGHVARILDERAQKLIIASKRNEQTKLRHIWGYWQKFMRMRAKEKLDQMKQHYEKELNESPQESLRVIERLQENHRESQKLIFAAGDAMLEILQHTLRWADRDVQEVLALKDMYPATAGYFFDQAHGQDTLEALSNGQVSTGLDSHPIRDDAEALDAILEQTKKKLGRMKPSDSLIQWLNFQRRRTFEATHKITPKTQSGLTGNASEVEKTDITDTQQGARPRLKEKQKQYKEVKGLQELRAAIASPGVMLKLLCHMSPEALAELQRTRDESGTTNVASTVVETLTSATTLSPSALLQMKQYFKIGQRVLDLPPDVISRDAFLLNDFDSLYAYAVYLYQFHSNLIAPGLGLSPQYRLTYNFFQPQWEKVKQALITDEMDPFAQQQFFIFLAKIRRVSLLFNRFGAIGRAIHKIAQWHQQTVSIDTYNDFARRVLGKDSNISVALEKETLAAWVSLPPSKLLPMCDSEDEFREVEQVFKDNVLDLIKIFRIYGSAAGGKGILEQEFLKVMTKAGVTDKKNILRSTLQAIYQQSRQVSGNSTLASGSSSGTGTTNTGTVPNTADIEEDDDRGATPNEFFEALTRVAFHNLQRRKDSSAVSASESTSLFACVTELVIERVVPLTKKFQEQGLAFKKQMIHPEVQNVCKAQEKKLKRVFGIYSQRNKNPNSRGKLMDLVDFESLLKDRRLIDALFPHGRIKQLVAFVQQDGEIATTSSSINGYEAECEFVYSEFIEALAAISIYRNANPYLPFAKKLETFFDENF